MKKFTIYAQQTITLEGQITIEAKDEAEAWEIERELLAEEFNLEQTDSVFEVLAIIEGKQNEH